MLRLLAIWIIYRHGFMWGMHVCNACIKHAINISSFEVSFFCTSLEHFGGFLTIHACTWSALHQHHVLWCVNALWWRYFPCNRIIRDYYCWTHSTYCVLLSYMAFDRCFPKTHTYKYICEPIWIWDLQGLVGMTSSRNRGGGGVSVHMQPHDWISVVYEFITKHKVLYLVSFV